MQTNGIPLINRRTVGKKTLIICKFNNCKDDKMLDNIVQIVIKCIPDDWSNNITVTVGGPENNKFVFYTMSDLKKRAALKKAARSKKTTKTKTAKTA